RAPLPPPRAPLPRRQLRQLITHVPELGEELAVDEPSEQLDGCSLGPYDLTADDAIDHLEVPDAPEGGPLVELGQRLGELVQIFQLAAAPVELRDGETGGPSQLVEGV